MPFLGAATHSPIPSTCSQSIIIPVLHNSTRTHETHDVQGPIRRREKITRAQTRSHRTQQQPLFFAAAPSWFCASTMPPGWPGRCWGVFFGSLRAAPRAKPERARQLGCRDWHRPAGGLGPAASCAPIATKSSLTFVAVFALVSMKKMPLSLAYLRTEYGGVRELRAELRESCAELRRIARRTTRPPRARPSASS